MRSDYLLTWPLIHSLTTFWGRIASDHLRINSTKVKKPNNEFLPFSFHPLHMQNLAYGDQPQAWLKGTGCRQYATEAENFHCPGSWYCFLAVKLSVLCKVLWRELQHCPAIALRWYNHLRQPETSSNRPHFAAAQASWHRYSSCQQDLLVKTLAEGWVSSHCWQLKDMISYGSPRYVMRGLPQRSWPCWWHLCPLPPRLWVMRLMVLPWSHAHQLAPYDRQKDR